MLAVRYHEKQAAEQGRSALADAILTGPRVTVRPVQHSDLSLIEEMHLRLSKDSVYYRYLAHHSPELEILQCLCFLDNPSGQAVVATVQEPQEKVIAVACYCVHPDDPKTAEPAILVEDGYQRRGLGKRVFRDLCRRARQMGVEMFECFTHPENHRALGLIRGCGLRYECAFGQGVREIRIWLRPA
jgi:GNAT superfamily N-acetyltransferase